MPCDPLPLPVKVRRLEDKLKRQSKAHERTAHEIAKMTAIAVVIDRDSSWLQLLNRLDRLERRVAELEK